jgi:serine-aspartate repeat-containing protein C/D/E
VRSRLEPSHPPPPVAAATLNSTVWLDKNANGVQDPGEPGYAGVVVILLDANGTQLANQTTGHPGAGSP